MIWIIEHICEKYASASIYSSRYLHSGWSYY